MPSVVVTANTSPQTVFTTPAHKVGRIRGIMTNNQSAVLVELTLGDTFTTDASTVRSTGAATSAATPTINRYIWSMPAGSCAALGKDDLEHIRILGAAKITGGSTQAACDITVQYELV